MTGVCVLMPSVIVSTGGRYEAAGGFGCRDNVLGLDEIRRSDESRYDHRLHGVLLVAQGMSGPDVARLLGDSARSVQYWVHRFEAEGFAGLAEGERPGRPSRLSDEQLADIGGAA